MNSELLEAYYRAELFLPSIKEYTAQTKNDEDENVQDNAHAMTKLFLEQISDSITNSVNHYHCLGNVLKWTQTTLIYLSPKPGIQCSEYRRGLKFSRV